MGSDKWPLRILKPLPATGKLELLSNQERRLFQAMQTIAETGAVLDLNRMEKPLISSRATLLTHVLRLEKLGFINLGEASFRDLETGPPVVQDDRQMASERISPLATRESPRRSAREPPN